MGWIDLDGQSTQILTHTWKPLPSRLGGATRTTMGEVGEDVHGVVVVFQRKLLKSLPDAIFDFRELPIRR